MSSETPTWQVVVERDAAILGEEWARAAELSDELARRWDVLDGRSAAGFRTTAAIYRARVTERCAPG